MSGVYEKALSLIDEYNLLADEGIIVCEHEKSVKIDFTPFEVEAEKRYGIKIVSYLRKKTNQIEVLKKNLQRDDTELKKKEKDLIDNAKLEARKILLDAKD